MEQFFAQNPAVALWLTGIMGAVIIEMLRRILSRFDAQDVLLRDLNLEFVRVVSGMRARLRALEMQVWGRAHPEDQDDPKS